jgi:hypothetical protein
MANSKFNFVIDDDEDGHFLFWSKALEVGGSFGTDIDNATAVSVINTGPGMMYVWCQGHHFIEDGSIYPNLADCMPLPPGQSITFSVFEGYASTASIQRIMAIASGTPTTCGWGVVQRR